ARRSITCRPTTSMTGQHPNCSPGERPAIAPRCRICGIPVHLPSLGTLCPQCWRWKLAHTHVERATRLLGVGDDR
ncbi:MAG: hypothetical protein ACREYC_25635, partial [Gammaproteobacteria bacterium]